VPTNSPLSQVNNRVPIVIASSVPRINPESADYMAWARPGR
jgi:hypothetical protein